MQRHDRNQKLFKINLKMADVKGGGAPAGSPKGAGSASPKDKTGGRSGSRRKTEDDEEEDDTWLYYSRKSLTTREIMDAGFSNVVLVDADEWRDEGLSLPKKVADDVQYSFAITADIETLDASTRADFEKEMLEALRWGDADVLIVVCDAYDRELREDDPAWIMVKRLVNLIEQSYSEGLAREYDDLPGESRCLLTSCIFVDAFFRRTFMVGYNFVFGGMKKKMANKKMLEIIELSPERYLNLKHFYEMEIKRSHERYLLKYRVFF